LIERTRGEGREDENDAEEKNTVKVIMKRRKIMKMTFNRKGKEEMVNDGRAIAQAVSHLLPTAAARVQTRVWSSGICGGQSGTKAGLLRVLLFPQPILIPPTAPQSSSIIRGWYSRPFSGRRAKWTQFGLHPPLREFKKNGK
jgi:hypothetical protein